MQISCFKPEVDPFDIQNDLTKKEVKDLLVKNPKKTQALQKAKARNKAPIPKISKLIMTPPPPSIGGDKTITFNVTDQVPLKDVLIELGRMADIDIDLDPSISGGVIINAKNRPMKEVIDRIATQGRLRYSYINNVLHFERDTPYMKNYFVDYLIDGQLWSDVESNINAILATSKASAAEAPTVTSSISSNKSAGIISIFATDTEHESIKKYLADVEKSASAQVLIEAKIVEVELNEEYQAGINWAMLRGGNANFGSTTGVTGGFTTSGITLFNGLLESSLEALETFGTTRTIASPRLHAINNQKATLNFADTKIYFKIDANQAVTTTTGATSANSSTITSTKQELDVGTKLEITPSINVETGYIVLNVKPTLSVLGSSVTDPASPTDSEGNVIISNSVPQVNTRVIETIAKIKSGDVLVVGGLMRDDTTNTDAGVPFLSRIPIFGWLFRSTTKSTTVKETVLFIKATIIKSGETHKVDKNFQRKLDTNRRRFFNY